MARFQTPRPHPIFGHRPPLDACSRGLAVDAASMLAIAEGDKTETRRLVARNSGPDARAVELASPSAFAFSREAQTRGANPTHVWAALDRWDNIVGGVGEELDACLRPPLGEPGALLYLQEPLERVFYRERGGSAEEELATYRHAGAFVRDRSTGAKVPWPYKSKALAGRYMRRDFARFGVHLLEVRLERLQYLGGNATATVLAEGVTFADATPAPEGFTPELRHSWHQEREARARAAFAARWDALNGHRDGAAWKDDPLVFVYRFEFHASLEREPVTEERLREFKARAVRAVFSDLDLFPNVR